jgi:O-acetyl-ADP-ribose deacetylase (regulator of RNase III)
LIACIPVSVSTASGGGEFGVAVADEERGGGPCLVEVYEEVAAELGDHWPVGLAVWPVFTLYIASA